MYINCWNRISFKLHKSNLVVAEQLYLVSGNTEFHPYEGVVLFHPPLMDSLQLLLGILLQLWNFRDIIFFFYQKVFDAIWFICISILACIICWSGVWFFHTHIWQRSMSSNLSVKLAVGQLLWIWPKQEAKGTNFSILAPKIEAILLPTFILF